MGSPKGLGPTIDDDPSVTIIWLSDFIDVASIMPPGSADLVGHPGFIPLDLIDKAPWNYKGEDEIMRQKLTNQIQENGQLLNCNVRRKPDGRFEFVDGNHRHDVYHDLSVEFVFGIDLRTKEGASISLERAQRLATEINESEFQADPVLLADLIGDLSRTFDLEDLAATLPFPQKRIESLIELSTWDWTVFDASPHMPGTTPENLSNIQVSLEPSVVDLLDEVVQTLQEAGHELHKRRSIRRGQALTHMIGDFLKRTRTLREGSSVEQ